MRAPGQRRYAAVLALIAVAILVVGLLLKPKPDKSKRPRPAELTVTRADLHSLEQLVQRNSLRNLGAQFSAVADRVSRHFVPLAPGDRYALVWSGSELLAPKSLGELPRALQGTDDDGHSFQAAPDLWIPGMPFAILRATGNHFSPGVFYPGSSFERGGWVAVVAGGPAGAMFRPGVYDGRLPVSCGPFISQQVLTSAALSPETIGGALYTLDGDLLGVVLKCEQGPAIIPPDEIRAAVARATKLPLLRSYGLRLDSADAYWSRRARTAGTAMVAEIWRGWPAEGAGLRPGDLITAVDRRTVNDVADAAGVLSADGAHGVQVRRGLRALTLQLSPIALGGSNPISALTLGVEDRGIAVERVAPGSSADRAGIRPGDRVLEINGRIASPTLIARTLAPYRVADPALVVVERGACSRARKVTP